ncbi:hypothetical protein EB118_06785 [bacterium]|nr:hypothetical protein [bacterium]NDC94837.1 hypothetical protein [bacterium]NDD85196.1 hypothetical protein [bacterium]NDG29785.1 hypothetical protein [bacterium]
MSDSKIRFNGIQEPETPAANRVYLWYDEDDQIFKIKRDNGVAEPLVGGTIVANTEKLLCVVRNQTGATLPKKTVVYISGATGNRPLVSKSQASSEMGSSKTFGILQQDILHNGTGYCVVEGQLTGVDTSMFSEGQMLWLSPTVAGGLTTTKPSAPDHLVFCGYVVRSHITDGIIEVKIQNGFELQELHNVAINGVTNGQALVYESSTQLWKNQTISIPPSNVYTVEYFTLDALNISSSSITLSHTPTDSSSVTLDVVSGSAQVYGEDYTVSLNVLSWDATPLYGILDVGDKLRVTYTR